MRVRLALAVATALILTGCVGTMPERTGYDRATGTWKKAHGEVAKGEKSDKGAKDKETIPVMSGDTTRPAGSLPDGSPSIGKASWYGTEAPNAKTASGEDFVPSDMTAAHRTLPFGTKLRVRYPKKGTEVVVRVNDRGPHKDDRILDLSEGAADALGLKVDGLGDVWLDVQP